MKPTPKRILSLFMSLLTLLSVTSGLTFTSFADDEIKTYGDFEYKTDGSDIYIYQYTGTDADVVIPSEIDGMKVTALGCSYHSLIFDPETKIRSVTIPETVTDVFVGAVINPCLKNIYVDENNASYRSEDGVLFNKDMTEIITYPSAKSGSYYEVPDSVTKIGAFAFCSNILIREIKLPDSITEIDDEAFGGCYLLKSINIPNGVKHLGAGVFENCFSLESMEIPDGITEISGWLFTQCWSLKKVILPDTITSIGEYTFYNCINLEEINFPGSLTKIDFLTFAHCYALKNVTIPAGVTDIDLSAFNGCTSLTEFNVDENNSNYISADGVLYSKDMTTLVAFPNGKSGDFVIPDSVTDIGSDAFAECVNLTSLNISKNFTGDLSFRYDDTLNYSIENIYVDEENPVYTSIDGVVYNKEITEIKMFPSAKRGIYTLPDTIESVNYIPTSKLSGIVTGEDNANYTSSEGVLYNKNMTKVEVFPNAKHGDYTLPSTVTDVPNLYGAKNIKNIYVESDNPYFSSVDGVLLNKDMTEVLSCPSGRTDGYSIPYGVTSIDNFAFSYCSALTSVTFPQSLTVIGEDAFSNCSSLVSIDLPESVKEIGLYAFDRCSSLLNVSIKEGTESIGGLAFAGCKNLTEVTIPKSVKEIDMYAFGYDYILDSGFPIAKDNFTICGYKNTAAETYANENGFTFVDLDPSSELILADGSNAVVDYNKNIISILGMRTNTIGYLKSQFESELETSLDDDALITDGTTVSFDGTEYKVLVRGDMNGDGNITAADCRIMLKTAAGFYEPTDDELIRADINSDGEAGTMEVRSVLRYVVRLTAYSIDESINDTADIAEDAGNPSVKFEYSFSGKNELRCSFLIENNVNHLTNLLLIDIPDGLTLKDITTTEGPHMGLSELRDDNTIVMSAIATQGFTHNFAHNGDYDCMELATAHFELSDDADMDNIVFNVLDGSCVDDSIPLSGEFKVETYSESFEYTENGDGTITITGFTPSTNSRGTLEIPSQIDGKTVTGIESYVLNGDYEAVMIPETITSYLDASTFHNLNKLKSITVDEDNIDYSSVDGALFDKDKTILRCCPRGKSGVYAIPDGVKRLNDSAFYRCGSLTELFIPASLESDNISLQQNFVSTCDNLESINVDENNEYFSSADGILYSKDKSTLIACPRAKNITAFTVEDCVERIGFDAFYGQSHLTSIVIPDSVTIIEREAFGNCLNLTQISISKNLTSIGYYAFEYTGYYYDESNWENGCLYLDNYLLDFRNWDGVDSVSIKDSTVLIAASAFSFQDKLKEVNIPDSMKYIGGSAFLECSSLESIHIPDSVSYIDGYAFYDCPNLKSVTLSKNVTEIGDEAFGYYNAQIEKLDGFTIYGYKNTAAETYASDNGFTFVDLDSQGECEHKNTVVKNAVSATCTTAGYTGDTYCADCNTKIAEGKTIPALGHKSETVKGKSSTCTEKGLTDGEKCSVCGIVIKEQTEIPALGHTSEVVKGKPATCTESGLTDGTKCSVCGVTLIAQKPIPALGHKSETVKGKNATCTEKGLTDGEKCSVCGTVIKEQSEIPALGHTSEIVKGKPATCTEKGLTDGEECSVCGKVIKEQTEIPALGHKSEAVRGKPATCTETGLTDGEKCSVCGVTLIAQKTIPALGHKSEVITGKNATCTETGLTDGEKCSVCGKVIKAQTEIPALGHTFENGVCTVCGAKNPDFKLVLAENHDKNITLDNEKKTVTSVPASVNGMTAGELKSQFGAQIKLDLDDSALVPNGTKFKYNGEEYTIIVSGDVSADGKITAADARALLRIAAKLDNPDDVTSAAADIDSNGKITSTEARNILRFAARLSNTIDGK